jgi:hypothetical protein
MYANTIGVCTTSIMIQAGCMRYALSMAQGMSV